MNLCIYSFTCLFVIYSLIYLLFIRGIFQPVIFDHQRAFPIPDSGPFLGISPSTTQLWWGKLPKSVYHDSHITTKNNSFRSSKSIHWDLVIPQSKLCRVSHKKSFELPLWLPFVLLANFAELSSPTGSPPILWCLGWIPDDNRWSSLKWSFSSLRNSSLNRGVYSYGADDTVAAISHATAH